MIFQVVGWAHNGATAYRGARASTEGATGAQLVAWDVIVSSAFMASTGLFPDGRGDDHDGSPRPMVQDFQASLTENAGHGGNRESTEVPLCGPRASRMASD